MRSIYFDYNATTPLDPGVREAMLPFLGESYGNPSSLHHVGRQARAALDEAHERVAQVWGCKPSEVVFTSGGTESINLALFGAARQLRDRGRHIITSSVEHHAVLQSCQYLERHDGFEVTYLPVDADGFVNREVLEKSMRVDTTLVSVMAANNETGTIQPVAEIGTLCRDRNIVFHTDAVQLFGKEPFSSIHQFQADLVSVCAHKFHGPKGAGALFIRSPLRPDPILFGGGHEQERRAGTENLPAIIGFTEATERFVREPVFPQALMSHLTGELERLPEIIDGVTMQGSHISRLCNTVAFTVSGCDSISLLAALDLEGICASSGSACSAGSLEPSHVLRAMGIPAHLASSFVRLSLGRDSSSAEVEFLLTVFPALVQRIRSSR